MPRARATAHDGTTPPAPPGMAYIPGGPFQMGDNLDGMTDAMPVHNVQVDAFFMDKTEVPKELWQSIQTWGNNNGYSIGGGSFNGISHPVNSITWYDAAKWCNATGSGGEGALCISEVDVALLLQVKAAIGAGIEILLEMAGVRAADLGHVYMAGGFGMHLNVAQAIAIGLLPGCRENQVRVVGNTALAGALLALVDRNTLDEMEALRAQVEVIELNLAEGFEDHYIDHLSLP